MAVLKKNARETCNRQTDIQMYILPRYVLWRLYI